MNVSLKESKVNEFSVLLFRALDRLDHLPVRLSKDATPTKLEKYPRLLFGYLQRYDDPKMAFSEWESKVLRDTPRDESNLRKQRNYEALKELEKWIDQNPEIFDGKTKRALLRHLRGSLYARIFGYLYPRRAVTMAVAEFLKGDKLDMVYGREHFEEIAGILEELDPIKEKVSEEEWGQIIADAKQKFEDSKYFEAVVQGKGKDEEVKTDE